MMQSASEEPGQVVTFYSYKGGTGRSMALANVACLLASRQTATGGKRVLAIDWDLEAPGLHRYFQPYLRDADSQAGLIELFGDVQARLATLSADVDEEERAQSLVDAIDVSRHVAKTAWPSLSFIRAGRFDETYSERVNTFPWQPFFRSVPSFYRLFAQRLAEEYSWILIDSRTGLTDISGVCTMLMPEKLVVVFTPNRQSLTGVVDLIRRATKYRRGSEDLRPLVVYPLPSRIETSVQPEAQRWRLGDPSHGIEGWQKQFDDAFRDVYDLAKSDLLASYFDDVQIQHVAPYSYGEPLPVAEERGSDRLTLTKSYETFRRYLELDAPWSEKAATAADSREVQEQIDRLKEAVRAQSTKQSWLVSAKEWIARHRLVSAAIAVALLLIIGAVAMINTRAERQQWSLRLLASALRDAQQNDNAVTALLLETALTNLSGEDRGLALRELRKTLAKMPEQLRRLQVPGGVRGLSFSQDGSRLLTLSGDGDLTLWNAQGVGLTLKGPYFKGPYLTAALRDDGSFVAIGTFDGGKQHLELRSPSGALIAEQLLIADHLLLSESAHYVLFRDGRRVMVFEIGRAKPLLTTPVLTSPIVMEVPFEPPAGTWYRDDLVSHWRLESLYIGNPGAGTWKKFPTGYPDFRYYTFTKGFIAVATKELRIWSLASAAEPLSNTEISVRAMVFAPAGTRIALALESGDLVIADVPRLENRQTIQRQRRAVPSQLAWDRDLLIAAGQGWIEVFDLNHPDVPPLSFEAPSITDFRLRKNVLAVGTQDAGGTRGEAVLLNVVTVPNIETMNAEARRALVCSRAGRDLESEEWTKYVSDRKYEPVCGGR